MSRIKLKFEKNFFFNKIILFVHFTLHELDEIYDWGKKQSDIF